MKVDSMQSLEYSAKVRMPFAVLGIRERSGAIVAIDYLPKSTEALEPTTVLAVEACRQLLAYVVNPAIAFDLPVVSNGTAFEERVWHAVRAIEPGRVLTYGAIARSLQSMPRAIGGACGRNPLPLVIPCHRVVAAGGRIGGFMGGTSEEPLTIKRWLLAHESRAMPALRGPDDQSWIPAVGDAR